MLCAQAHSPPRGVWGHAPPENFGNLDSLRMFLRLSDSHLGADLVQSSKFYLSTDMPLTILNIYSISSVRYLESGSVASLL